MAYGGSVDWVYDSDNTVAKSVSRYIAFMDTSQPTKNDSKAQVVSIIVCLSLVSVVHYFRGRVAGDAK